MNDELKISYTTAKYSLRVCYLKFKDFYNNGFEQLDDEAKDLFNNAFILLENILNVEWKNDIF